MQAFFYFRIADAFLATIYSSTLHNSMLDFEYIFERKQLQLLMLMRYSKTIYPGPK